MLSIMKFSHLSPLVLRSVRPLVGCLDTLKRMRRVAAERQALRQLDARQLSDIGLSRADALFEADRPFWDLPPRVQATAPRLAAAAADPCAGQPVRARLSRAA